MECVAHNKEHPDEPIRVCIGPHTGEAIKEGQDFFGKSVILAARIASQAEGEQVLVSSLLKALVDGSGSSSSERPKEGAKGPIGSASRAPGEVASNRRLNPRKPPLR